MKKREEKRSALMSRKKILALAFSLILLCVIFAGASYAYLQMGSEPVVNSFVKGSVEAEIHETVTAAGDAKTSITVENSGASPAYARVRLVSYWKDSNGNIAPKASETVNFDFNSSDWKQDGDYYYYRKPLAGGATTENLIGSGSIVMRKDAEGNVQYIEVLAELVQATPAKAVKEVWGIEDAAEFFK